MASQRRRINRLASPISGTIRTKSRSRVFKYAWARFLSAALIVAFIGQYGSAQACQQRIGCEPCEIWQQIGDESNDYCSKPIPCLPGPRMTSRPDVSPVPGRCPVLRSLLESSLLDDDCSKPLPKLCPTPPVEIQESRKRPKSKADTPRSLLAPVLFSVVGGESCCQDDYCRKPLPSPHMAGTVCA